MATPQDVQSARSAQASAQAGLQSAQAKLAQLQAGPTAGRPRSGAQRASPPPRRAGHQVGQRREPATWRCSAKRCARPSCAVQQAQIDAGQQHAARAVRRHRRVGHRQSGRDGAHRHDRFMTLVDPHAVPRRRHRRRDRRRQGRRRQAGDDHLRRAARSAVPRQGHLDLADRHAQPGRGDLPGSISIDNRNQVLPGGLTASATIVIDEKKRRAGRAELAPCAARAASRWSTSRRGRQDRRPAGQDRRAERPVRRDHRRPARRRADHHRGHHHARAERRRPGRRRPAGRRRRRRG